MSGGKYRSRGSSKGRLWKWIASVIVWRSGAVTVGTVEAENGRGEEEY